MEELSGERENTFKYFLNGYFYHKINKTASEEIQNTEPVLNEYRCATRSSTTHCTAYVLEKENQVFEEIGIHADSPDEYGAVIARLKERMLKLSGTTSLTFLGIYDFVLLDQPDEIKRLLKFGSVRTMMIRKRNSNDHLLELVDSFETALQDKNLTDTFCKEIVKSEDGLSALILMADKIVKSFIDQDCPLTACIDDSFAFPVIEFELSHLYTISLQRIGTSIGQIFTPILVLMTGRSSEIYQKVWSKIFELVPSLKIAVIKCGFKSGSVETLQANMPEADIYGTWHHYIWELLLQWKKLKLTSNCIEILWMAMSLPLAPISMFQEGLNLIQSTADVYAEEIPPVNQYTSYLRSKWVDLADCVNTFYCTERIDSYSESFRNSVISSMQQIKDPTIVKFLRKSINLLTNEEKRHEKYRENEKMGRGKSLKWSLDNGHIKNCQEELSVGRLTLKAFLSKAINGNRRIAYNALLYQMDANVRADYDLLSNSLGMKTNGTTIDNVLDKLQSNLNQSKQRKKVHHEPTVNRENSSTSEDMGLKNQDESHELSGEPIEKMPSQDFENDQSAPEVENVIEENGEKGEKTKTTN